MAGRAFGFCLLIACASAPGKPPPDRGISMAVPDLDAKTIAGARRAKEKLIAPHVAEARRTYPDARQRFLAGLPAGERFFVTMTLWDGDGIRTEDVFVGVDRIANETIYGRVNSDIELVTNHRRGDFVTVKESEILDWTIAKRDGTEEGNYVGKFYDSISPPAH